MLGQALRQAQGGIDVAPVVDPRNFDGLAHLGDYTRLPEWIGYFEARIRTDGWAAVSNQWVAQLAPAFDTKLFHGAIRTGHAVRALSQADTPARQAEPARALAYWAGRYRVDRVAPVIEETDAPAAVLDLAAVAARRYVEGLDIFTLHGVTSAMAAALLLPHLDESKGLELLAHARATHEAFFGRGAPPSSGTADDIDWGTAALLACASQDPHQVNLVEACKRGFEATNDGAFAIAVSIVTAWSKSIEN